MHNSLIGIAECKFFIQFRMGTFPTSVLNSSEMLKDNFNQQAHSRQLNSGTLNSKKLNSNICHISPLIRLEPNLTDLLIRENLPVHQELQENRNKWHSLQQASSKSRTPRTENRSNQHSLQIDVDPKLFIPLHPKAQFLEKLEMAGYSRYIFSNREQKPAN